MLYIEFDWTFGVYRFRVGQTFTDLRGVRSWESIDGVKADLRAADLRLGRKTDSRTWTAVAA